MTLCALTLLISNLAAGQGQQTLDQMRSAVLALKSVKGEIRISGGSDTAVQASFYVLGKQAFGMRRGIQLAVFDGKTGWILDSPMSFSETERSAVVQRMALFIGFDAMFNGGARLTGEGAATQTSFNGLDALAVKLATATEAKLTTTVYIAPSTKLPLGYSLEEGDKKIVAVYSNVTPNTPMKLEDFKFVPPKGAVDLEAQLATKNLLPVGTTAPPVQLLTATGIRVDSVELRKKAKGIIVVFWDPESSRSMAEVKKLEKLRRTMPGLELVGVMPEIDPKAYRALMDGNGFGFKSASDYQGETLGVFGVKTAPTTYVLNAKGVIVARYIWNRNEGLLPALKKLGFKPPAP